MFTTSCFLAVLFAAAPASVGAPESLEATAEATVRVKLNRIETGKLLDRYAVLIQREKDLQDSIRSAEGRQQEYKEALGRVRDDLGTTKRKLVGLEVEKARLIEQFGKMESGDASTEPNDRMNRTLEKILERLTAIEKHLEKK
jgi:chromosome segregation ATPase